MLSESDIQAAKSRDLVQVVEYYGVKLQKAGTKEYKGLCPFHSEDTPSFTVTPEKNLYRCMGCGAGGDPITFVRELQGLSFRQAVMTLNGQTEGDHHATPQKQYKSVKIQKATEEEWEHVFPVPDSVPSPRSSIKRLVTNKSSGEKEWVSLPVAKRWTYRDANGGIIGYTVRVNLPPDEKGERKKEVLPQIWAVNKSTGEASWRWLSFAEPRPVYGLDLLAQNPSAKVLVVEGEKACEAARELLAALGVKPSAVVVVAWPGGGKAVAKVDWSPLAGREVFLWPDADQKPYPDNHPKAGELMPEHEQPGHQAMIAVAKAVRETATAIKMIKPPVGVPDGWDLADEMPVGFDLTTHIRSHCHVIEFPDEVVEPPKPDGAAGQGATEPQPPAPAGDTVPSAQPTPEPTPAPAPAPEPVSATAQETKGKKEPRHLVDEMTVNEHFQALGFDRETYYFFSYDKQQMVTFTRGEFTETGLMSLAPLSYWEDWKHPVNTFCTPENPPNIAKSRKRLIDAILQASHRKGVFDPSNQRGRGAWRDDGRMVLHTGYHLVIDGKASSIPEFNKVSRYVYELDRALPSVADDALSDEEGQGIVDLALSFRWTRKASGLLLAGWAALAPFSGALQWRPHVWVTGGAGCGKTTLINEFVFPLLNGYDLFAQGNSSEAGIRQKLRFDALPVIFDESEQNDQRESARMQAVLALMRQSSSESAARTYKGTTGGNSMDFLVRSMFCLSSIQVGIKHQADRERLAVLALRPKRESDDAAGEWKVLKEQLYMLKRDGTLPARLMRRSLDLLPITLKNIDTFASAGAKKFGSQRDGDQYGTLLAGAWSLMSGDLVTEEDAMALLDAYDWADHVEHADIDDSTQALSAILEARVRANGGVELSVYEVVESAAVDSEQNTLTMREADALLQRHGMRVKDGLLLFSNKSEALPRLVANTKFESDLRSYLKRITGATNFGNKAIKIGPNLGKAVAIPLTVVLPCDNHGVVEPPL